MSLDLDEVHINKEESCAKKLLLENVPPPPKSQPPRIDELTSALEKQLSEIEKHVVEKRKQSAEQKASSIELAQKTITGQQQKLPVPNPSTTQENSTKFGNSMREMLKNVVSSQKNVLHKKVDTIEQTQQQTQQKTSGNKMGKFFQTLSLKNSLSKSSQSLEKSKSKDSLVSSDSVVSPDVNKQLNSKSIPPPVLPDKKDKKRSKSLSSETRLSQSNTKPIRDSSSNRSELGSSSAAGKQSTSGSRAEGQVKTQTRWLGKNPFDTSPATEVVSNSVELNPFMPHYTEPSGQFSGISQNDSATTGRLAGTGSNGTQRCPKEKGSALGKSEIRVENPNVEFNNSFISSNLSSEQ